MTFWFPKLSSVTWLLTAALFLYAANLREVFDLERFNPIEKSTWLILSIVFFVSGKVNKNWITATGLVVSLAIILALFNNSNVFSSTVFFMSLSQIPILFFLCGSRLEINEFKDFFLAFSFMPLLICIFGFIYQAGGIKELFQAEYYTGLYRFGGSMIPAYLAGWCLAAIFSSLALFDLFKKRIYLCLLAINFFILFLTVARVPLFIAFIISIFYFVFRFKWLKGKLVIFTYYSIPVLLFAIYFLMKNAERLFSGGTSGRDLIWDHLLYEYDFYFKPFGAGFGHQYLLMDEEVVNLTGTIGAHNDYIRLLVELGFVGSLLFWFVFVSAFLISLFGDKSKSLVDRFEIIVIFATFLLFAYFDNVLAAPAVFSYFILAMMKYNTKLPNQ